MGWYTFVDGEMFFYKETWNYKEDVQIRIDDNKKDIEDVKLEMAMLAAGSVKDLIQTKDCEDNDVDVLMAIRWKLEDLWERLENAQYENWKLEFLLENWDSRHGDFIDNPNYKKTPDEQSEFNDEFSAYTPPIQPDDENPKIVIDGESAPLSTQQLDSDPKQLKLEFDASIEETSTYPGTATPKFHSLGSLNDINDISIHK